MPVLDHLRELRSRVFKAVLAVIAGAIAGWFLYRYVWPFLERPYCKLGIKDPLQPHSKICTLFVNNPFDGLFIRLKVAIATGVILSAPVWLFQIWAFVAPGLHARERKWAYFFGGAAVPLFAAGGAAAYYAMTKGLRFLVHLLPGGVTPLFTVDTYISYAMAMLLIFALAFELPLFMVLLNLAGVLTHKRFAKWRRMIIFLVFAFAAFFTPSPDPISMLLLALPCVVLVELAEIFAWTNDRRKARRGTVFPGLTADEIAEYGLGEPLPGDADSVDADR